MCLPLVLSNFCVKNKCTEGRKGLRLQPAVGGGDCKTVDRVESLQDGVATESGHGSQKEICHARGLDGWWLAMDSYNKF